MAKGNEAGRGSAMPSLVPDDIAVLSGDECVTRLARAIETRDPNCLQEVARLIGRLAAIIE